MYFDLKQLDESRIAVLCFVYKKVRPTRTVTSEMKCSVDDIKYLVGNLLLRYVNADGGVAYSTDFVVTTNKGNAVVEQYKRDKRQESREDTKIKSDKLARWLAIVAIIVSIAAIIVSVYT
jgi:hypothetical protein